MKIDRFVLFIIITIALAYFFPGWAVQKGDQSIEIISSIGVSLIFFFYGLKLSFEKLREGLKNWQLHLLVQSTTFLIFPLIVLLFYPLANTAEQKTLWLAIFFLAALPSTVSSSVVMVSIAKGNIPAAIFNASLSGIIGIALTPIWMGLFIKSADASFDFGSIYLKLLIEIIVPVILGIVLQPYFGKYIQKHASSLAIFDKAIILLIIYKSFAESFFTNVFDALSLPMLLLLSIIVIALFFVVYHLTGYMASRLNFSLPDRITTQFCGTKKSLVHGTVFSKILFANSASAGILLLPLMLFHALQILIVSVIATKLGQREAAKQ
ncbi:bile acid:sodium symporter [Chryseotalea sanaruensis]|uniref:Bile acid:sodium symporter n=1 Tax=Chryseotalea sanaruensis TaxID=2482724 RepID=A0A401UD09_9BACT|nr:bile acid:sodium symporter family protein [Chryseotalea sanaruensis]GCC52821.1 bile acid:sodium symporter [Chryseotalea sanaruensis]